MNDGTPNAARSAKKVRLVFLTAPSQAINHGVTPKHVTKILKASNHLDTIATLAVFAMLINHGAFSRHEDCPATRTFGRLFVARVPTRFFRVWVVVRRYGDEDVDADAEHTFQMIALAVSQEATDD